MLSAGDWVELHQALGQALGTTARMKSLTAYVTGSAALGQRPLPLEPDDAAALKAFCAPLSE